MCVIQNSVHTFKVNNTIHQAKLKYIWTLFVLWEWFYQFLWNYFPQGMMLNKQILPIFGYFMSHGEQAGGIVNLLNLTLCKSLPRMTYFSSFCKPLLQLKWNSPPNKLGFVKCQLSNHRRLRSIQVLIVSRSCQTHNDASVSINQTFPFSHPDKSIFADDHMKRVLFKNYSFVFFICIFWVFKELAFLPFLQLDLLKYFSISIVFFKTSFARTGPVADQLRGWFSPKPPVNLKTKLLNFQTFKIFTTKRGN